MPSDRHVVPDRQRMDHQEAWSFSVERTRGDAGRSDQKSQADRPQPGGGEVRIHGRDGKIRDSDTVKPGNDPVPPRDTK